MESFPQEVPNESERIDDVEKAQSMAYAGKQDRDAAAEIRATKDLEAKPEGYYATAKTYGEMAEKKDENAEALENYVGHAMDAKKENPDISDHDAYGIARKKMDIE